MKRIDVVRPVLALAVVVFAAACGRLARQPEVTLESVRVDGIGLQGGTLVARVQVFNPNAFALEAEELTYDLQIAHPDSAGKWVSFTSGRSAQRIRVPGDGATMIEVPIPFRYEDLGGAVRQILAVGRFDYRVVGDVRLSEPVERAFPYSKTGVITLAGIR